MFNRTTLIGTVKGQPELRYTAKVHRPVAEIRVATTRAYYGRDGQPRGDTQWHRVVVWGKDAEACKEQLQEGDLVFIDGRIQERSWTDQDGNKRYATEIVAEKILFLDGHPDVPAAAVKKEQHDPSQDEAVPS